jgi:hypothetical protein
MGSRAGLRLAGPQKPEVFSSESSLSLSTLPALPDLCLERGEASLKPASELVSREEKPTGEELHEQKDHRPRDPPATC